MWTPTRNKKFSLQNHNEVYLGDVFIGYQVGKDSTILIDKLNLDIETLESIHWTINDSLYANKAVVIEIKNRNFNDFILDRLNWVCPFTEEHTHYAIKSQNVYTSFLTTSYKEAVQELIKLKKESKKLPTFEFNWEIKPLLLT